MNRLSNIMKYHIGSPTEQKNLLNSHCFPEDMKSLLLGETNESTDLVKRELIGMVGEGIRSRESVRNVVPMISVDSNTCRINYGTTPSGQYADYVPEGGKIPIVTNAYSYTDVTIKKVAIRPAITWELIEDSMYDLIGLEIKRAAALVENKLNQEVMTTFLDGATTLSAIDPGTHFDMQSIGLAKGSVDENGWMADSVLIEPKNFGYMLDETNLPDIGKLAGLNYAIVDCSTDGTGTAYWDGTDSANHYGGLVFDSYNFGFIAMRDDIHLTLSGDPVQDLVNSVVSMRFGVGVLNTNAACRILTK